MNYAINALDNVNISPDTITTESVFVEILYLCINKLDKDIVATSGLAPLFEYGKAKAGDIANLTLSRLTADSMDIVNAIGKAKSVDEINTVLVAIAEGDLRPTFKMPTGIEDVYGSIFFTGKVNRAFLTGNTSVHLIYSLAKAFSLESFEEKPIDRIFMEWLSTRISAVTPTELKYLEWSSVVSTMTELEDIIGTIYGFTGEYLNELNSLSMELINHSLQTVPQKLIVDLEDFGNLAEAIEAFPQGIDLAEQFEELDIPNSEFIASTYTDIANGHLDAQAIVDLSYSLQSSGILDMSSVKSNLTRGIPTSDFPYLAAEASQGLLVKLTQMLNKQVKDRLREEAKAIAGSTPNKSVGSRLGTMFIADMRWNPSDKPASDKEVLVELLMLAFAKEEHDANINSDITQYFQLNELVPRELVAGLHHLLGQANVPEALIDLNKETFLPVVEGMFNPLFSLKFNNEEESPVERLTSVARYIPYIAIGNKKLRKIYSAILVCKTLGISIPYGAKDLTDDSVMDILKYSLIDYEGIAGSNLADALASLFDYQHLINSETNSVITAVKDYYNKEADEALLVTDSKSYALALHAAIGDREFGNPYHPQVKLLNSIKDSLAGILSKEEEVDVVKSWTSVIRNLNRIRSMAGDSIPKDLLFTSIPDSSLGKFPYLAINQELNLFLVKLPILN